VVEIRFLLLILLPCDTGHANTMFSFWGIFQCLIVRRVPITREYIRLKIIMGMGFDKIAYFEMWISCSALSMMFPQPLLYDSTFSVDND
jgi:hypothetical protein